jgi:SAM-dependent methyltransferase
MSPSGKLAQQLLETLEPEFLPDCADYGREFRRYRFVLSHLLPLLPKGGSVLDLGARPGVVPLAMRLTGANVTVADKWEYYGGWEPPADDAPRPRAGTRTGLKQRFEKHGVTVLDLDLTRDKLPFHDNQFDMVLLLAVIEHLPIPPKRILEELRRVLKPGGVFALEVPNIAALRNRVGLLFGRSVHCPLKEWYFEDCYRGHFREMTCAEVKQYIEYLNMELIALRTSNTSFLNTKHADGYYERRYRLNSLFQIAKAFYLLLCAPFPGFRFQILALARKRA